MSGEHRLGWPYLSGLGALVVVPLLLGLGMATTRYSGLAAPTFVGLDNFTELAGDDRVRLALINTLVFVAISVPLRLAGVTIASLSLHGRGPGKAVGRVLVYLPTVVPDAAYALLWAWLLNPVFGPLASAWGLVSDVPPSWLTSPWQARVAVGLVGSFQIGEGFIVALAWRRSLPPAWYELARLEGATPWYTMCRITLPSMTPLLVLLAVRDALLVMQSSVLAGSLITGGGPNRSTTSLGSMIRETGFAHFRLGYAAALSITMLAVTAVLAAATWWLTRRQFLTLMRGV